MGCPAALEFVALPHQDTLLPSLSVASDPAPSRWCGRRPQPGDEHQNFLEHRPRYPDLRELERDVAAMAHHLDAGYDEFFAQIALGIARVRTKLPRGESMEL
jgi:hypothetical protein